LAKRVLMLLRSFAHFHHAERLFSSRPLPAGDSRGIIARKPHLTGAHIRGETS
jgi:hypothetical protein